MTTNDIVDRLSSELNITKKETKRLLDRIVNIWVDQLESDRNFTIPELGTFGTHTRESHVSYNPYYQTYMRIPPKKVVDFKASRNLKTLIESESSR